MSNKYKWNICPRCHLAYIPWKKNQTFCSIWCELLEEGKMPRGTIMNNEDEEKYIEEELSKINFEWKEKKVNDIESNPVECWWTIGELGTLKRFYKIVPFEKCNTHGLVLNTGKYFVLFEALGLESDKASPVAIYDSLSQAKERAKFQLFVIHNIIQNYCPNS